MSEEGNEAQRDFVSRGAIASEHEKPNFGGDGKTQSPTEKSKMFNVLEPQKKKKRLEPVLLLRLNVDRAVFTLEGKL